MTYDPMLTSFIIVSVFGSLAVFLNITSDWEVTTELAHATDNWTAPLVVRRYRGDAASRQQLATEAGVLGEHGCKAMPDRRPRPAPVSGPAAAARERAELPGARVGDVILVTYLRS